MKLAVPQHAIQPYISIGIIAWNEQEAIVPMLNSLLAQTVFVELAKRGLGCELFCIANGCTDRTAAVASDIFERQARESSQREVLSCEVVELAERGKLKAWNQFVHRLSHREARFLFLMDADIILHHKATLQNMLVALEQDKDVHVVTDSPRKQLSFKSPQSLTDKLSLRASEITTASSAQLCAQLYAIRSEIARNIYLPKDLTACEDGFIKHLVCTNFLTTKALPERIFQVPEAEHTFEAYTSPFAIFKNQKRQIIGQTIVHLLIDKYLPSLAMEQRHELAVSLKELDRSDSDWLKRLIRRHLKQIRFFWKLYPDLLTHRIKLVWRLKGYQRLKCLPVAMASSLVTFIACWMAYRTLKGGRFDYWPPPQRLGLNNLNTQSAEQKLVSIN